MAGRQPDEPLFTSPSGGVLRLNNWRHRVFDPACQRAGLIDVTPHDLRHTAASLAIRAGANGRFDLVGTLMGDTEDAA